MLNLMLTTDKLQLVTSAVASIDVHISFVDLAQPVSASTYPQPGKQNTAAIATATTTDICAAPASSTTRNVKTVVISNTHASASCDVTPIYNQNATLVRCGPKQTLAPGDTLEYIEGVGWYKVAATAPGTLLKILTADDTGGQNVATAQPWFPTAGGVTVASDTTYLLDGRLLLSRAAGTTSHTTSLLFAGTAVISSIVYMAKVQVGDTMALLPLSRVESAVLTSTAIKIASIVATEQITVDLEGVLRVTTAGTFIPQFIYSAAPGGTPTILRGSRFMLTPVGSAGFLSQGVWA